MRHLDTLEKIKGLKVAIIGDMMVDKTIAGGSSRMSPECPDAPVIDIWQESITPGGAANVAMNLSSLGAAVTLFTTFGKDDHAKFLVAQMERSGITIIRGSDLYTQTIQKCRVFSNERQICRIDHNPRCNPPVCVTMGELRSFDLVILSDYGYGAITQDLVDKISGEDRTYTLVADPKPRSGIKYKGVDVITPNEKELYELTQDVNVFRATEEITKSWGIGHCVTTRGSEDTLVCFNSSITCVPPEDLGEGGCVDPCGAGDTFVAALGCAYTIHKNILLATSFANKAAAVVVGKHGTAVVCPKDVSMRFKVGGEYQ
jgi:D-beta-D-heptose 7-phosphate kinase/D-beta-D-heptose 1-phosphate adenosyltransferase